MRRLLYVIAVLALLLVASEATAYDNPELLTLDAARAERRAERQRIDALAKARGQGGGQGGGRGGEGGFVGHYATGGVKGIVEACRFRPYN